MFFVRNAYREEMLQSWRYCQENKGMEIYAWCIMPSHVHMIISSKSGKLEDIVRDMKIAPPNYSLPWYVNSFPYIK